MLADSYYIGKTSRSGLDGFKLRAESRPTGFVLSLAGRMDANYK
jgi:hypothetical protein